MGIFVEKVNFIWDTPAANILPNFEQINAKFNSPATMRDLMGHRIGLAEKSMLLKHYRQLPLSKIDEFKLS